MKTIGQEWYKVNRKDGNVQYATKHENGWLLGGSGFVYEYLDAISIEPIDGFPPTKNKHMLVGFDDTKMGYKAIVDLNDRWNGWLRPYIAKDDALRMLNDIGTDESWIKWVVVDDVITITDVDYGDDIDTIELEEIDGEQYYYFGNLGWVFDEFKGDYNDTNY